MSGSTLEQQFEQLLARLSLRIALGGLAVVVLFIAWNRGIALLYGMFALLIAALGVGWLAPRLNLRGVEAQRSLPAKAHEGEQIPLQLTLTARRRRYMLELADRLPFAEPEAQAPFAFIVQLHGSDTLTLMARADLRGVHRVGPLRLRTAYPLGIRRVERELAASEAEIVIYPTPFPIRYLPLLSPSHAPTAGVRAAAVAGGAEELFGVREYRRGDSPRHIHWPAFARHRQLVVREYELLHTTDLLIVLDLRSAVQVGEGKHSTLEYAVKIAASCARWAIDEGHGVGLAGFGTEPLLLPVARGPHHYQTLLELLARVVADGATPYPEAVHRALPLLPQGGAVLLFDIPPVDLGHPGELWELRHRHAKPLWVRFDSDSFHYPLRRAARRRVSDGVTWHVRREDDLAAVFAS